MPFPSPGELPNPGIKPMSIALLLHCRQILYCSATSVCVREINSRLERKKKIVTGKHASWCEKAAALSHSHPAGLDTSCIYAFHYLPNRKEPGHHLPSFSPFQNRHGRYSDAQSHGPKCGLGLEGDHDCSHSHLAGFVS